MKQINYFFLLFFLLFSQEASSEKIKNILVDGNKRISDETVIMFSGIRINQEVNENKIDEILKNLYDTNFFEDISVNLDQDILKISLIEYPIVQDVIIKGIKSDKLEEEIIKNLLLKKNSSFNKFLLKKDLDILTSNLKSLGYYSSIINSYYEVINDNMIILTYDIKLNNKAKIKKISFLGDKVFKDKILKNIIASEEFKFWKFLSRNKYLNPEIVNFDNRLLKNYYLNNGYYDVEINSSFAKLVNTDEFELTYNIDAKNKFYFGNLNLDLPVNFQKSNFEEIENLFNKLKGEKYSLLNVEKILNNIDTLTTSLEFESVNATVEEIIKDNTINLNFKISETENIFVEKINILGNNITRENVIRNQIIVDEGDRFNEILFNKSINNLKNLNFFKSVKTNVYDGENYNSKIIDINLEEKATGEIMAGAGFGTSGASIMFSVKENNFMGKGIAVEQSATINQESIKGNLNIFNPNYKNSDKSVYLNFQALETDQLTNFGYKSNKIGFSTGTNFEYKQDFNLGLGFSNYLEKIETNSTASVYQQKQKGNYFDFIANLQFNYDKRNQKFKTSEGFLSSYNLDIPLVSNTNTLFNSYEYKYFTELYDKNITTLSFMFRAANSLSSNAKLSERLYVPLNKLRGFERGKVGPKDGSDFIGGNYLTTFNFSSTLPNIFENYENADFIFFFDVANLWGVDYNSGLDKNNKIKSSAGIGVDWFTQLGPLTFSLALPITSSNTDITETFRFNIGTSF